MEKLQKLKTLKTNIITVVKILLKQVFNSKYKYKRNSIS